MDELNSNNACNKNQGDKEKGSVLAEKIGRGKRRFGHSEKLIRFKSPELKRDSSMS